MTDLTLEERMTRLERQNHWLKVTTLTVVLVLAAIVCMGQARSLDTVEAGRFILRDANGVMRGGLGFNEHKQPTLSLYDGNGDLRASLGVTQKGPLLLLADAEGKKGVVVEVVREGPTLGLSDSSGKHRLVLCVTDEGPSVNLDDPDGTRRAALGLVSQPGLTMLSKDGAKRLQLGLADVGAIPGSPCLVMRDENGNVVFSLTPPDLR